MRKYKLPSWTNGAIASASGHGHFVKYCSVKRLNLKKIWMNTSDMLTGLNSEITAWLIPLKLDGKSAKPCLLCLIVLA